MSKTIASVLVQLLVIVLPMMGITVGSEQLTATVQTLVIVISGLVIWFERLQRGDVSFFGARKVIYSRD